MKNYTMNFATKTLTMTKDFAAKAMIPNSEESSILLQLQNICPNLKIKYRTHKATAKNPCKGLTFKKMENYIKLCDNADELLRNFETVKAIADIQSNKYTFVYKWFISKFPNYKELPIFDNGKLVAEAVDIAPLVENTDDSNLAA